MLLPSPTLKQVIFWQVMFCTPANVLKTKQVGVTGHILTFFRCLQIMPGKGDIFNMHRRFCKWKQL